MSGIRNSRTRLIGAAATVVLAALSLTACKDGTGLTDEGASTGASAGTSGTASHSADTPASDTPVSDAPVSDAPGSGASSPSADGRSGASDRSKPGANSGA
ncbi:DUF4232 domain-containing protein, partial [Streptomyces sp. NPDC004752]